MFLADKFRKVDDMANTDKKAFADFFPTRQIGRPRPVSAQAQKLMDRMEAIGGVMSRGGRGWEVFYDGCTSSSDNLQQAEWDVEDCESQHQGINPYA